MFQIPQYVRCIFLKSLGAFLFALVIFFWPVQVAQASSPTFDLRTFPLTFAQDGYFPRMVVGDFNNDGKPDMVLRGRFPSPGGNGDEVVLTMLGDGAGGFGPPIETDYGTDINVLGDVTEAIVAGDFNHDGKLDLVLGANSLVAIVHGDGTGHFGPAYYYNPGDLQNFVIDLAVGDFNHDNRPDVAGIGFVYGGDFALLGDGFGLGGAFFIHPETARLAGAIAVGDFNNDSNLDIVLYSPDDARVLLGNGFGNFPTVVGMPLLDTNADSERLTLAVADYNSDGNADIALPNGSVLMGDGAGGFAVASYEVELASSSCHCLVSTADVNGDGKVDLISKDDDRVSIVLGDGHGGFSPTIAFPLGFQVDYSSLTAPLVQDLAVSDLNGDGKPDVVLLTGSHGSNIPTISVLLNTTYQTPIGTNSTVTVNNTTFTFDEVTTGGTTTVTPIDPASVGEVPGGFAVSNSVAYEIGTTATFTGSVTLAFKVPGPISQEDFNSLAILHNVNGTLVDVTASTPARDYANLTIYATTTSFSPFYLARRGPHIKSLFDQTKAYKRGSTIPIKLQVLNASNANLSSSNTSLVTRDLRLMSGNTLAPIEDSGNANPDYTFRYDSTLGGAGGGYIFNLSTKGLASGQYVLSFYVGTERSFFYTVKFEVK